MNKNQLAVFAAAFLVTTQAGAIELGNGVNFKAFGTLGLVYSNNDGGDYVTSTHAQAKGAGNSSTLTHVVDTKLGAQFDWQASDRVSLSTQFLTKQFEDGSWTPRIESGFLKYELVPELDVRVGRIRPPVFNLSDFLEVNYANPWVRAPIEHYSAVPFSYMDGADLLWQTQREGVSLLVQPYIGQVEVDNAWDNTNHSKVVGINTRAGYGDFTFRAGYALNRFRVTRTTIDNALDNLQVLCQFDPVACDLRDEIDSDDAAARFISLGGSWDNGDYFVIGEWSNQELDVDFFPGMHSWYLSGGARIDSWTPYITYSTTKDPSPIYNGSAIPDTNYIINQMHSGVMQGQHSITLGLRYDFMPNMALKAQWDHVQTDCRGSEPDTCNGVFANRVEEEGFSNEPQEAEVFSLSIDFIY